MRVQPNLHTGVQETGIEGPRVLAWIRRNLDISRSDFGRQYGWFVECRGKRVAELVDPVWDSVGQFWHFYTIVPSTTEPDEVNALATAEFWHQPGLVYQNRKYGTTTSHALAGVVRPGTNGWVVNLRSLYVPLRFALFWEFVCDLLPARQTTPDDHPEQHPG